MQNALRQMGQLLFAPPNVKGWDGGKAWITNKRQAKGVGLLVPVIALSKRHNSV